MEPRKALLSPQLAPGWQGEQLRWQRKEGESRPFSWTEPVLTGKRRERVLGTSLLPLACAERLTSLLRSVQQSLSTCLRAAGVKSTKPCSESLQPRTQTSVWGNDSEGPSALGSAAGGHICCGMRDANSVRVGCLGVWQVERSRHCGLEGRESGSPAASAHQSTVSAAQRGIGEPRTRKGG